MKMKRQLIANKWRTPDGTVLWSKFTHDFVQHTDKNGDTYFVDGGNSYIRLSDNDIPMTDMCIYSDDDFDVVRMNFLRGTFDKSGNRIWVPLYQMSDEHIVACILYCLNKKKAYDVEHVGNHYAEELYVNEYFYRKEKNISLPDYEYSNETLSKHPNYVDIEFKEYKLKETNNDKPYGDRLKQILKECIDSKNVWNSCMEKTLILLDAYMHNNIQLIKSLQ